MDDHEGELLREQLDLMLKYGDFLIRRETCFSYTELISGKRQIMYSYDSDDWILTDMSQIRRLVECFQDRGIHVRLNIIYNYGTENGRGASSCWREKKQQENPRYGNYELYDLLQMLTRLDSLRQSHS